MMEPVSPSVEYVEDMSESPTFQAAEDTTQSLETELSNEKDSQENARVPELHSEASASKDSVEEKTAEADKEDSSSSQTKVEEVKVKREPEELNVSQASNIISSSQMLENSSIPTSVVFKSEVLSPTLSVSTVVKPDMGSVEQRPSPGKTDTTDDNDDFEDAVEQVENDTTEVV